MNEDRLGIILGIIFTLVVALVAAAGVIFYIYYRQPEFICELCATAKNCSMADYIIQGYNP